MATVMPAETTTSQGNRALRYVGADERGRELEVIALELGPSDRERFLLVIHVMPTMFRRHTDEQT